MNNSDSGVQLLPPEVRRNFSMMYIDYEGKVYGGDFKLPKETTTQYTCEKTIDIKDYVKFIDDINDELDKRNLSDSVLTHYYFNNIINSHKVDGKEQYYLIDIILNVGSYLCSLGNWPVTLSDMLKLCDKGGINESEDGTIDIADLIYKLCNK